MYDWADPYKLFAKSVDHPAKKPKVELWTDGACIQKGLGSWAFILRCKGREKAASGVEENTTSNCMELRAAIAGLHTLKRACKVTVYSDSQYMVKGMTEWVYQWIKRNWRKADGKPVINVSLWHELLNAASPHEVRWQWVRSHSGIELNERVDRMCTAELHKYQGRKFNSEHSYWRKPI